MAWQTPKTDWATNPKNPKSEDFNRIEGNIKALKEEIETKKGEVVNALNSVGINTVTNQDTHSQIGAKIKAAEKKGVVVTPGASNKLIPAGIYHDEGYVAGDPDLIAANIKNGVDIFGVKGNSNVVDTSAGDATATQILSGKKAYVDGSLITGIMTNRGAITITPKATDQVISEGYHNGGGKVLGDSDLKAANIKAGIDIFGVSGLVKEDMWDTATLYRLGNIYEPLILDTYKSSQGVAEAAFRADHIYLYCGGYASNFAMARTTSPVNLTNRKAVIIDWEGVGPDSLYTYGHFGVDTVLRQPSYSTNISTQTGRTSAVFGRRFDILNVFDVTGNNYIYVWAREDVAASYYGTIKVYAIYLI